MVKEKQNNGLSQTVSQEMSRRGFFKGLGGSVLFCGTVGSLAGLLNGCEVHGEIPRISGGLLSFITPTEGGLENDLYIQFGNPSVNETNHPRLGQSDWSLEISGAVTNSIAIDYGQLIDAAETESILYLSTLRCVFDDPSTPLIGNGYWRGVPLSYFLNQAAPAEGARRLRFTGEDGFYSNLRIERVVDNVIASTPLQAAVLPVLLAYELNGSPIPSVHGGPVRLIVPGKFGYKNMKFPRLVEVTEADTAFGYYEEELFNGSAVTDQGDIPISSLFTGPVDGSAVSGPTVTLSGVAMTGPGQVSSVSVSIDGGGFVEARIYTLEEILADVELCFGQVTGSSRTRLEGELEVLRTELSQTSDPLFEDGAFFTWSLWTLSVDLSPGEHTARVRALSASGEMQSDTDTQLDDGNSAIRQVKFIVS